MSKKIAFTIWGNQEHADGNPIPYFRITSQSKFSQGAKRYHEWKSYVRGCFIDELIKRGIANHKDFRDLVYLSDGNPIVATKSKIRMDLDIKWANHAHGDCDNIFKGIADALFVNDKYVCGSFDYAQSEEKKGSVGVIIIFDSE